MNPAAALFALKQILRFDPRGADMFPNTPQAVLSSFRVAFYVAPVYILQSLAHYLGGSEPLDAFSYIVVEVLSYVIGWVLFPVVILQLAPHLTFGKNVFRYLAAYNWLQVFISAVLLPFVILRALDLISPEPAQLFIMIAATAFMVYNWFVARHALKTSGGIAVGFVLLDMLLSLLVNASVQMMTRGGP